jgi:lysophospholipase L1-like esterase
LKLKEKPNQFKYHCATALIMPLLLIQAMWVRLTVLRLPEPCGERSGRCGDGKGKKLKLLVIGDSAAAGVGVAKQKEAITGQLITNLSHRHNVNWRLVASNGYTSSDIIKELAALAPETFDYVLISIGVNDVTSLTRSNRWTTNIKNVAKLLDTKFGAPKVLFSSLPPMQLFKAIPFPLSWWLGIRAKRLNELMRRALENNQNFSVLIFDLPFKPEFLAKDGIHPSEKAYSIWAQQVAKKIENDN